MKYHDGSPFRHLGEELREQDTAHKLERILTRYTGDYSNSRSCGITILLWYRHQPPESHQGQACYCRIMPSAFPALNRQQ